MQAVQAGPAGWLPSWKSVCGTPDKTIKTDKTPTVNRQNPTGGNVKPIHATSLAVLSVLSVL